MRKSVLTAVSVAALCTCMALCIACAGGGGGGTSAPEARVSFGFEPVESTGAPMSAGKPSVDDADAIVVSIEDAAGTAVYTDKQVELHKLGDSYVSEPLALPLGTYQLTKFWVLDEQGDVIFVTPLEGSPRAYLVDDPLPIEFATAKDEVTTLSVQVVDTEGAVPGDFGYGSFALDVVETFDFQIAVFVVGGGEFVLTTADLTVTSGAETLYEGGLDALTNAVEIRDGYEEYQVLVEKVGYESYTAAFSKEEMKAYGSLPLVVTLLNDNLIIFCSERDGDCDIYVIRPDGTGEVNITNTPDASETYPVWSPDKTRILFSCDQDLWVMNADGSSRTNLTDTPNDTEGTSTWSPDGTKIAFLRSGTGLFVANADGTDPQQITSGFADTHPDWSPDGSTIVFARPTTPGQSIGHFQLFTVNVDGTNEQQITNRTDCDDYIPCWSPDGTKIVFQSNGRGGKWWAEDIYVMDADGSNQVNIRNDSERNVSPVWSPDGSRIVYSHGPYNTSWYWELWTMNADGTNPTQLTACSNTRRDSAPDW